MDVFFFAGRGGGGLWMFVGGFLGGRGWLWVVVGNCIL